MEDDIIASAEGESPPPAPSTVVNWQEAVALLSDRRYDALSGLLAEAETAAESAGETASAHVVAAARQVSMACGRSQSEVEWHAAAADEAREREQALQRQLHELLALIGGATVAESPHEPPTTDVPTAEAEESPGLWQRMRSFVGRTPGRPPASEEAEEVVEPVEPEPEEPIEAPTERASPPPAAEEAQAAVEVPTPDTEPSISTAEEEEEPNEQPLPKLVVYCLGPFRVYHKDELIRNARNSSSTCERAGGRRQKAR
jgi:hypothetical protein